VRVLRDYQVEGADAVEAELAKGVTRTALVAATGLGKSTIIAELAQREVRRGGSTLCLAHRVELTDQIRGASLDLDPSIAVGSMGGGISQRGMPITVAMTPTLAARVKRLEKAREDLAGCRAGTPEHRAAQQAVRRAEAALPPRPTRVIYDECHHAPAVSSMTVLRWAGCFDHVPLIGATATLVRGDRLGLGDVFESVAFSRDIVWAVEQGWLVRPHGRVVVVDAMRLDEVTVRQGDYAEGELGAMVSQSTDEIVKAWHSHASSRITATFTPSVQSARDLADAFIGSGVAAEVATGTMGMAERNAIYARLAAGVTRVLCGVMVTTEGWDCPPVSCILVARPTQLPGLYQQIVGRGLRPSPATGKRDCLILDVVGASRGQRLTTLVDLMPSADYDTAELDEAPCLDCGLYPCECEVGDDGLGVVGRDPDGGRTRLIGPAAYEELDLFGKSELAWLFTKAGTRFLPCGDRIALLWENKDGTYRAGHTSRGGPMIGTWLIKGADLDTARHAAEAWALEYAPSMARKGASWRRAQPPSPEQIRRALGEGIAEPERYTRARLSDELSIVVASRRLDPRK
jgi:superfamily II DNA or RNA helicase